MESLFREIDKSLGNPMRRRSCLVIGAGLLQAGAGCSSLGQSDPVTADPWRAAPLTGAADRWLHHSAEPRSAYLSRHLPAPPVPDSVIDRGDVEQLTGIALSRTMVQIQQARFIEAMSFWPFLHWAYTDRNNYPANLAPIPTALHTFMQDIREAFEPILIQTRMQYPRTRPGYRGIGLQSAWPTAEHNSYPSAKVWLFELQLRLLRHLDPAVEARTQSAVAALRLSRLTSLVHYPSDVDAAITAAASMAAEVVLLSTFQSRHHALLADWQRLSRILDCLRPSSAVTRGASSAVDVNPACDGC